MHVDSPSQPGLRRRWPVRFILEGKGMKHGGRCLCLIGTVLLLSVPAFADVAATGDPVVTDVDQGIFYPFLNVESSLSGYGDGGIGLSSPASAEAFGADNYNSYSYTVTLNFAVNTPGEFILSSVASAALYGSPVTDSNLCIGTGVSFSAVASITGGPTSINQQLTAANNTNGVVDAGGFCEAPAFPSVSDQGSDTVYLDAGAYSLEQTITVHEFAAEVFGLSDSLDSTLVDPVPEPNGYSFVVGIGAAIIVLIRQKRHHCRHTTISG
jgi:hypothetical protein